VGSAYRSVKFGDFQAVETKGGTTDEGGIGLDEFQKRSKSSDSASSSNSGEEGTRQRDGKKTQKNVETEHEGEGEDDDGVGFEEFIFEGIALTCIGLTFRSGV
jgi:hypothetical protein